MNVRLCTCVCVEGGGDVVVVVREINVDFNSSLLSLTVRNAVLKA